MIPEPPEIILGGMDTKATSRANCVAVKLLETIVPRIVTPITFTNP